jgi:hypothetical protein
MSKARPQETAARTVAEWQSKIAEQAGADPAHVRAVLERHGIDAHPTLPRARTLSIQSIEFDGVKVGNGADTPFHFSRMAMGPGIWAFMSDENSRGKSSILLLLRCALLGDFPGCLKPDIWKWLSKVDVRFCIDRVNYRVFLEKPSGSEKASDVHVELARGKGDGWTKLHDGQPGDELKARTAELFMDELSFAKFHAFSTMAEDGHSHGWPAMASALFISEPGKIIFGDNLFDGLPLRLLQLFIGLPWVSTYSAANARAKMLRAELSKPETESQGLAQARARLATVTEELQRAKRVLAACPNRDEMRKALDAHDRELARIQTELAKARDRKEELEHKWAEATATLLGAKRLVQHLSDEKNAGYVFRRLRPVCCPACESSIDEGRYRGSTGPSCALCGSEVPEEVNELDVRIEAANADLTDAESFCNRLARDRDAALLLFSQLQSQRDQAVEGLERVSEQLASPHDLAAEQNVLSLVAREAELTSLVAGACPTPERSFQADGDLPIIEAAEEISKAMFEGLQREVLSEVSSAILLLAQKLGVENVSRAEFDGGGRLFIDQGGTRTSFSKLSPGERLRFRVAAALAVIEVADKRGHGRHPGLLVLDSPGAQEMAPDNFASLVASLQDMSKLTPEVQFVIGAVARPQLVSRLAEDHAVYAQGKNFLF